MNFNVYIDKGTVERLERLAKARRADAGWSRAVLDFEGVAGAKPFERSRRKLRAPRRDPFA